MTIAVHPFTCRCPVCREARPVSYVHDPQPGDAERHLRLIREQERLVREDESHERSQ